MRAKLPLMEKDPGRALVVIPASSKLKFALGFALWDDTVEAFRAFVRRELAEGKERIIPDPRSKADFLLPTVVSLVPRPDNEYNPLAVSVAVPPGHGGTAQERHLGYMYDSHLSSRARPIHALAAAAGEPVGCHAFLELYEYCGEDEYYSDEEDEEIDRDHPFLLTEYAELGYDIGGLKLRLPWWEDMQEVISAYTRQVRPGHINAYIGHWASWLPGMRDELLSRTGGVKRFEAQLRLEDGRLSAHYGDLVLAELAPSRRDFFDRTLLQVQEFGGSATVEAEHHEGSLMVFVEDSRPLD